MLNFIILFIVKKEVFEWISTGQKTVELRGGKAKHGDNASSNVEGTFSEGIFSNEKKVV
jgi:hypothetical protein